MIIRVNMVKIENKQIQFEKRKLVYIITNDFLTSMRFWEDVENAGEDEICL
jgi:hypothetical protein